MLQKAVSMPSLTLSFWNKNKTRLQLFALIVLVCLVAGAVVDSFAWLEHLLSELRLLLLATPYHGLIFVVFAALCATLSYFLIFKIAPEAAGSGIQEVKDALAHHYPLSWRRVLPIKFVSGLGLLASGMILGRAGPAVQMAACLGFALSDVFRLQNDTRRILVVAAIATAIAATFNAPLAAILFTLEEMQLQTQSRLLSLKAILVGATLGALFVNLAFTPYSKFFLPFSTLPSSKFLLLYPPLGALFGFLGLAFNKTLLSSIDFFHRHSGAKLSSRVLTGTLLGMLSGFVALYNTKFSGAGLDMINEAMLSDTLLGVLVLFVARFGFMMLYSGSGAAGGLFAPILTLGALAGLFFGKGLQHLAPQLVVVPEFFVVAGMAAFFAATVRAPLTATALALELTNHYPLALPILITAICASFVAEIGGGKPIYRELIKHGLQLPSR